MRKAELHVPAEEYEVLSELGLRDSLRSLAKGEELPLEAYSLIIEAVRLAKNDGAISAKTENAVSSLIQSLAPKREKSMKNIRSSTLKAIERAGFEDVAKSITRGRALRRSAYDAVIGALKKRSKDSSTYARAYDNLTEVSTSVNKGWVWVDDDRPPYPPETSPGYHDETEQPPEPGPSLLEILEEEERQEREAEEAAEQRAEEESDEMEEEEEADDVLDTLEDLSERILDIQSTLDSLSMDDDSMDDEFGGLDDMDDEDIEAEDAETRIAALEARIEELEGGGDEDEEPVQSRRGIRRVRKRPVRDRSRSRFHRRTFAEMQGRVHKGVVDVAVIDLVRETGNNEVALQLEQGREPDDITLNKIIADIEYESGKGIIGEKQASDAVKQLNALRSDDSSAELEGADKYEPEMPEGSMELGKRRRMRRRSPGLFNRVENSIRRRLGKSARKPVRKFNPNRGFSDDMLRTYDAVKANSKIKLMSQLEEVDESCRGTTNESYIYKFEDALSEAIGLQQDIKAGSVNSKALAIMDEFDFEVEPHWFEDSLKELVDYLEYAVGCLEGPSEFRYSLRARRRAGMRKSRRLKMWKSRLGTRRKSSGRLRKSESRFAGRDKTQKAGLSSETAATLFDLGFDPRYPDVDGRAMLAELEELMDYSQDELDDYVGFDEDYEGLPPSPEDIEDAYDELKDYVSGGYGRRRRRKTQKSSRRTSIRKFIDAAKRRARKAAVPTRKRVRRESTRKRRLESESGDIFSKRDSRRDVMRLLRRSRAASSRMRKSALSRIRRRAAMRKEFTMDDEGIERVRELLQELSSLIAGDPEEEEEMAERNRSRSRSRKMGGRMKGKMREGKMMDDKMGGGRMKGKMGGGRRKMGDKMMMEDKMGDKMGGGRMKGKMGGGRRKMDDKMDDKMMDDKMGGGRRMKRRAKKVMSQADNPKAPHESAKKRVLERIRRRDEAEAEVEQPVRRRATRRRVSKSDDRRDDRRSERTSRRASERVSKSRNDEGFDWERSRPAMYKTTRRGSGDRSMSAVTNEEISELRAANARFQETLESLGNSLDEIKGQGAVSKAVKGQSGSGIPGSGQFSESELMDDLFVKTFKSGSAGYVLG